MFMTKRTLRPYLPRSHFCTVDVLALRYAVNSSLRDQLRLRLGQFLLVSRFTALSSSVPHGCCGAPSASFHPSTRSRDRARTLAEKSVGYRTTTASKA